MHAAALTLWVLVATSAAPQYRSGHVDEFIGVYRTSEACAVHQAEMQHVDDVIHAEHPNELITIWRCRRETAL